ncbi:MAG: protein phosphatase 2C domain-containing protein [Acholeplasmataceae bacterium]|nr:protein phosphatase 2C domain-containing protein [Acholeplasmataceae bacterium]
MKSVHGSCIGQSHVQVNKPRQDAAYSFPFGQSELEEKNYAIGIVCDGHGSPRYFRSDIGSVLATEAVFDVLNHFVELHPSYQSIKNINQAVENVKITIIAKWTKLVRAHLFTMPIKEDEYRKSSIEELVKDKSNFQPSNQAISEKINALKENHKQNPYKTYGTTVLAVLLANDYHLVFQLGDGLIIQFNHQFEARIAFHQDNEHHEGPHSKTDSLCTQDAYAKIKVEITHYAPTTHLGFFICTDGVSEAFTRNESLFANIKNIVFAYQKMSHQESTEAINEWLEHVSLRSMAKDDASLALVLNRNDFS